MSLCALRTRQLSAQLHLKVHFPKVLQMLVLQHFSKKIFFCNFQGVKTFFCVTLKVEKRKFIENKRAKMKFLVTCIGHEIIGHLVFLAYCAM